MTSKEQLKIEQRNFRSAIKSVEYEEGVVIGSYVGKLEQKVEELESVNLLFKRIANYSVDDRMGEYQQIAEQNQRYEQALQKLREWSLNNDSLERVHSVTANALEGNEPDDHLPF